MGNITSNYTIVYRWFLLYLIIHSSSAQYFNCQCDNCLKRGRQDENCTSSLPETVPFQSDNNISNPCSNDLNRCDDDEVNKIRCGQYRKCCDGLEGQIYCQNGPKQRCQFQNMTMSECYRSPMNCICSIPAATDRPVSTFIPNTTTTNSDPPQQWKPVVIGIGIGLLVLIAIAAAMMIYCRRLGLQQGRKESQLHINYDRDDEQEDYAEIDNKRYSSGPAFEGTLNPGYDVVNKETISGPSHGEYSTLNKSETSAVNSNYKSLKKPNQDLESSDYTDPEKYTEPPHLNTISSHHQGDDDDYISQDTPNTQSESGGKKYNVTLAQSKTGDDYTDVNYSHDDDREYFTLEPAGQCEKSLNTDGQNKSGSNYVNVDDPILSKSPGSKSSSDYVDVDDLSLAKRTGPKSGSDYVGVDDPSLSKFLGSKSGSHYVDVDDPSLSKFLGSKSGSHYVDVDDPSLSKILGSKSGSDYVDVDDLCLSKSPGSKSGSDYVDVDDPSLKVQ